MLELRRTLLRCNHYEGELELVENADVLCLWWERGRAALGGISSRKGGRELREAPTAEQLGLGGLDGS